MNLLFFINAAYLLVGGIIIGYMYWRSLQWSIAGTHKPLLVGLVGFMRILFVSILIAHVLQYTTVGGIFMSTTIGLTIAALYWYRNKQCQH